MVINDLSYNVYNFSLKSKKKHIISTCNGNFDNKFFIFLFVFVICYCWQSIQYSQSWAHGLIQIQTRVAPELHNWLMIQKSQVFSIYNLQNKQINYFNRKYLSLFIAKTESSLINSTGHKKAWICFCFLMLNPADKGSHLGAETESPQLVRALFLHQLDLFFCISQPTLFFHTMESPQFSSRIPESLNYLVFSEIGKVSRFPPRISFFCWVFVLYVKLLNVKAFVLKCPC